MGFFSGLASLFSSNKSAAVSETEEAIEYNGFSIIPAPIAEGGQYRVAATITKGKDDTLQTHQFIRSDVIANRDECIKQTIRKTKVAIDQSGDALFR